MWKHSLSRGNPANILSAGQGSDVREYPVNACEFHPPNFLVPHLDAPPSSSIQSQDSIPIWVFAALFILSEARHCFIDSRCGL